MNENKNDLTIEELMNEQKKNIPSNKKSKKILIGIVILFICALIAIFIFIFNQNSIESDLKNNKQILNETNSIIDNYEQLGINLDYVNTTSGSEINTNFKNGECDVKLIFDKNSEDFIGIELKDNGISNSSYSDDYINTLENTLDLNVYEIQLDTRNDIIDFFNEYEKSNSNIDGYLVSRNDTTFTIKNKTEESLIDAIPITIDEIELIDTKCYTDSIGTHWMEAKFKNNSDKIITYISYEYAIDDETTYLSSSNTLNPGETSTKEDTFGPKSNKFDDAELLKFSITYKEDGEDKFVDYDAKLGEYSWY